MVTASTGSTGSQNSARVGGIFSKRVTVRPSGITALGDREKRELLKKQKTIDWILGATRVVPPPLNSSTRQSSALTESR